MSLRDDFEKKFGPEPEKGKPYSDGAAHLVWTSQLEGYQAATQRAMRIANEVASELRGAHLNSGVTVAKIAKRIKGGA